MPNTIELQNRLDDAIRRGDVDLACDIAKQIAAASGHMGRMVGGMAIVLIVASAERVTE
jgi:hypothetical protein